jgi:hypothetical protein
VDWKKPQTCTCFSFIFLVVFGIGEEKQHTPVQRKEFLKTIEDMAIKLPPCHFWVTGELAHP